ncbi:hypothetical protein FZC84_10730 [Rossellomorea vietnamensis]|uniref:Uncharacterized protein n=1 Tax=Rossellomorea vietnamensis TaxID=218284 RepID=A0A5D4MCK8_9BACI|nr:MULTISPECIES: hypothetical protein [Bacillaceae]TYR99228.1 hypothetical protein FZC84_10730 [Rossellomorea vietnamensis]
MKKHFSFTLIAVGFLVCLLFLLELIGEFSPNIEGIFLTFGIPWRYPFLIALLAFSLSYWLKGSFSGLSRVGMFIFFAGSLIFIALYTIAFFSIVIH